MVLKAVFFDVGGTVFDWRSAASKAATKLVSGQISADEIDSFANDWRQSFFARREAIGLADVHRHQPDDLQIQALKDIADRYAFLNARDEALLQTLTRTTWHNLAVFAGAVDAVARIRAKYPVIALTILSFENVIYSSRHHGLDWDAILPCQILGASKPDLAAYAKACSLMRCEPSEALMVASHPSDLAAAKTANMRTAYVAAARKDDIFKVPDLAPDAFAFDIEVSGFDALCEALDC